LRFVVFIVSGRLATDYLEELSMESHGDSIEYKGFKIQATPSKRNGKWTWEIVISHPEYESAKYIVERPEDLKPTRDAALSAAFESGRKRVESRLSSQAQH
jgi:hypothetical protein